MEHAIKCEVEFIYSYGQILEPVKAFVEREFLEARSKVVDLLNPHYDEWNDAYTTPVDGENDEKYNSYIRNKQDAILNEFNRTWFGPVKLFSGKDGDIAGRFKYFGRVVEMHMVIKEIFD